MSIKSITKWKVKDVDSRAVLFIQQKYGLPEIVSRIIVSRGIDECDVKDFLNPSIRSYMQDPYHLLDMDVAVDRVCNAISNNEKICIYGDYDVDGATSTAMLVKYLRCVGANVSFYIPDRIREGYGPNEGAMCQIGESGVDLCITVDCGTVAHVPISACRKFGLEVIVIDHHLGSESLPEATAIVNPNRLDQAESKCRDLAAVGVSFLFLAALNTRLVKLGFNKLPNILNYLDLVALGTVCDVVKLRGLNRAFVSQGLKVIAKRANLGLTILSDMLNISEQITSYHLGFIIGPNINAGGRVGDSRLGAELLSTDDRVEANRISCELISYNTERKAIESQTLEEAIDKIEEVENKNFLMPVGYGWHPGVIGIIASRIKDKFNLPVAVISIDKEGVGKASARSIKGLDFGAKVLEAKMLGLILEGGGHAMAAGFSVSESMITELYQFFSSKFESIENNSILELDGILSVSGINIELYKQISVLAPFGVGNNEPRFALSDIKICKVNVIKNKHVKCLIYDFLSSMYLSGIAFSCVGSEVGEKLIYRSQDIKTVIGKVRLSSWNGVEKVQFFIDFVV